MASEIDDLKEHYDRYWAVTLEHLQRLSAAGHRNLDESRRRLGARAEGRHTES